ncbi:GntR family transcriptional regulator [Alkalihalobacillus sp. 1P02AB]|uniref:GntR family transcriptional regulator n=1 Tax=Alkalihalobacillus sp. 1P02AB TaxID=3132260 RepID=UPI0039A59CA0
MEKQDGMNVDSPILLYEEIKAGIREMIKKNNLKSGHKLPNESELCEFFNVSRITIRRAIKELINEGIIEVIRGKGTFVKASKKDLHLLNLKGFTEGLSTIENNIEKEVLSKKWIQNETDIAKAFSFQYTDFLELTRIVTDADGPFSVDFAYFPADIFPGIEPHLIDNISTFELIRNEYGIEFTKVHKEIEYVHPTPEICEYLGVNKTSVVILVKKVIFGADYSPVHYSNYYLMGDKVKFYIEADYKVDE